MMAFALFFLGIALQLGFIGSSPQTPDVKVLSDVQFISSDTLLYNCALCINNTTEDQYYFYHYDRGTYGKVTLTEKENSIYVRDQGVWSISVNEHFEGISYTHEGFASDTFRVIEPGTSLSIYYSFSIYKGSRKKDEFDFSEVYSVNGNENYGVDLDKNSRKNRDLKKTHIISKGYRINWKKKTATELYVDDRTYH